MTLDTAQYGFIEEHPTAMPLKVLIRFHHGLGDTVQLSVVLKHLRRYRPNWTIDVWCGQGKHSALFGLCNRVWHDREAVQPVIADYDRVVEPGFWEDRDHTEGMPNTKAVATLRNTFGIDYDPELGRYELGCSGNIEKVIEYVKSIGAKVDYDEGCFGRAGANTVVIHAHGNTSSHRKNLYHWQVEALAEQVIAAGRIPVILDWDNRSPLPDNKRIFCPGVAPKGEMDLWGGFGSGDAATIAALIGLSEAFIGVDSGPGKIASATDTPSLICWHGHHPMQFHDPAPNTTHLVPHDHWRIEPLSDRCVGYPAGEKKEAICPECKGTGQGIQGDGPDCPPWQCDKCDGTGYLAGEKKEATCQYPKLLDFFVKNYLFLNYQDGMYGLLEEAQKWLSRTLRVPVKNKTIQYVLPTGIGDSVWALHKIRAVNDAVNPCKACGGNCYIPSSYFGADDVPCPECNSTGAGPIDIILSGDPTKEIDNRSVPFLKRFKFVNSVKVLDVPVLKDVHNPNDRQGRYVYQDDGLQGTHYFLTPNHALERGVRLSEWLPEYPVDWGVMRDFDWSGTIEGGRCGVNMEKFVAFYLGPLTGNTTEGHNRGPIWTPFDWIELGRQFKLAGYDIAVIGADYDFSYWEENIQPHVSDGWFRWISCFEIGEMFAFLKHAACLFSYQCGLGIVHHYLGGKVVQWWRPDQNSIHPDRMVAFSEKMATAWINPALADNYVPLIYGKETAGEVFELIRKKGWLG